MKKIFATVLLIFVVLSGQSQSFENFERLKSEGPIPEDFLSTSTDKFNYDFENNLDKGVDKEFFINTRFFIDELLLSGKVIFNDPISEYISDIALHLLKDDFKTYNQLRFYTIKSNVVNAFATDQGIIFFTTGLISRLTNEAELAFIIAHEIAHHKEKHIKEGYIEKEELEKLVGKYKNKSYDEFLLNLSRYNRANELEADKKGAELFYQSNYAPEGINGSFDILMKSHVPFENIPFENTFFNASPLKIPTDYFVEKVPDILMDEYKFELGGTHPNIITRKQNLEADSTLQGGNQLFHFPEERFNNVRELARYETVRLNLLEGDYITAIYHIYCIKKLSGIKSNRFLDLSLIKAFYGIAKYHSADYYSGLKDHLVNFEGEIYKLYHLIAQLNKSQVNSIAFRHVYDISEHYQADSVFQIYRNEMAKTFILNPTSSIDSLRKESYANYLSNTENFIEFDVLDSIDRIYASELTDYEKLQLAKKVRQLEKTKTKLDYNTSFHLFAFTDIVGDSLLNQSAEDFRQRDSLSQAHGDKNIVIVDPKFESYNFKEKDHVGSEATKIEMISYYTDDYEGLDLNRTLLDRKNLTPTDVETFNDLALLSEWRNESIQTEINMLPSSKDLMLNMEKKYGTRNFLFSGVYAFKGRHQFNSGHLVMMSMIVFIPVAIFDLTVPHNYFEFIAFTINSTTGEVDLVLLEDANLKGEAKILRHYIYHVLFKLSQRL